jgi:hypothetical protein
MMAIRGVLHPISTCPSVTPILRFHRLAQGVFAGSWQVFGLNGTAETS